MYPIYYSVFMRVFFGILSGVFALFAYWQYNDPDPQWWIPLYGVVSIYCALAAGGRVYRPAVWVWLVLCMGWAFWLLPEVLDWAQRGAPSIVETMKAEKPWIEYTREFLGLLLAAGACATVLRWTPASKVASL